MEKKKHLNISFYNKKKKRSYSIIDSIRLGMIYAMPVFVFGAIILVVLHFPIEGYQNFIKTFLNGSFYLWLERIHIVTFGIISCIVTCTIAYARSSQYSKEEKPDISYVVLALITFLLLSDFNTEGFDFGSFNVQGIFVSIVSSICSTSLFYGFLTLQSKRKKKVLSGMDSDFNRIANYFVPFFGVILVFAAFRVVLFELGIVSIQESITNFMINIFKNMRDSFLVGFFYVSLVSILWFFCIHGGDVLEPVVLNHFSNMDGIFSKSLNDVFVLMGGCGATLCLILAILIFSRNKRVRKITYTSLPFAIFNISETAIFGIPIVFNPVFIIPFILTPLVLYTNTYLAIYWGLVPPVTGTIFWTTPIFFSGYIATGSIKGILLQLFNLIVGVGIYAFFVKWNDKLLSKKYKTDIKNLEEILFSSMEKGEKINLLSTGNIYHAEMLGSDIFEAINHHQIQLYYQPQIDRNGVCYGSEALLRFFHPELGYVAPPVIVQLSKEIGILELLEDEIFETAISYRATHETGIISINSTSSTFTTEHFLTHLVQTCKKYNCDPKNIAIEITEETIIADPKKVELQIEKLREYGFTVLLDDFGMGHTSLIYLQNYKFDTVKIAAEIVKEVATNESSQNIIKAIVELGYKLGYNTTAEYVDSREIRDVLIQLGIDYFQGYLYSKAIDKEEYQVYYEIHKKQEEVL